MSSNNDRNRMTGNNNNNSSSRIDTGNQERVQIKRESGIPVVEHRTHEQISQQQVQYRTVTSNILPSQSNDDYDNTISNNMYGVGSVSPNNIGMIGHDLSADELHELFSSVNGVDSTEDNTYRGGSNFTLSDSFQQQHHHQNAARTSSGIQEAYFPGVIEHRVDVTIESNTASNSLRNTKNNQLGMTLSSEHGGYDRQCSMASANDPSDGNQSDGCGYDDKLVSRTERKRSREKQRRSDVNKQFNDLTACLRHIESEYDSSELRAASLPAVFSASNRADLLARTVALLHALNNTSKRQKKEISDLQSQLDISKHAGEEMAQKLKDSIMAPQNMGGNKVMVMVPMMLGNDGTQHAMMYQNPANTPMWGMNQMQQQQQQQQHHQVVPAQSSYPFMMPSPAAFLNSHSAVASVTASSAVHQQQSNAAGMNTLSATSAALGAHDSNVLSASGVETVKATQANANNCTATSAVQENNQQQALQQRAMMTQVPHWGMIQQQQQQPHAMQQMPYMMMPPQQQFMPSMMMPMSGSADGGVPVPVASASGPTHGVTSSTTTAPPPPPLVGMTVQQHQQQSVMNSNTSSPTTSSNSGKSDGNDPTMIGSNLAHCA